VYLSEFHGNYSLSSTDKYTKTNILKWLFWESSHWQPTLNRVLAPRVGQVLFDRNNSEIVAANWEDPELVILLDYLESLLSTQHFINSDLLTIADYTVAGMTTYFEACKFPKNAYPAIQSWIERMDDIFSRKSTMNALWTI
jgi:glutathione S-transferase